MSDSTILEPYRKFGWLHFTLTGIGVAYNLNPEVENIQSQSEIS